MATLQNESRSLNALNVSHENNQINDIYQGKLRDTSDPERQLGFTKYHLEIYLKGGNRIVQNIQIYLLVKT